MKKKILITSVIVLVVFTIMHIVKLEDIIKGIYISHIDYNMKITKDGWGKGRKLSIEPIVFKSKYVLLNFDEKKAYFIEQTSYREGSWILNLINGTHSVEYEIRVSELTDEEIENLKTYANLTVEDKRHFESVSEGEKEAIFGYSIDYEGKITKIKERYKENGEWKEPDFVELFY